jgi:hypothetical protein
MPRRSCPICQCRFADTFVRLIRSARPVGKPMNLAEFEEWLKRFA